MLDHWGDVGSCDRTRSSFVVLNAREGILKFALHVICGAGFGVKLPFKPTPEATHKDIQALFKDAQSPPAGYHYTFRSLMEYMNHHVRSVFLANGVLPKWIPRALLPLYKPDFDAHDDLQSYLRAMVTSAELQGSQNDHNLLEEIVNARNGEPEKAKTGNGTSSAGFSEEEIHGNLYIFTVAGHETTATTLRYALVLLALNPGVQDELHQEIRQALCDEPLEPEEWDYSRVFPKLVAPLCVMVR